MSENGEKFDAVDERAEAKAVFKLAIRGYAAAALAGVIWYMPTGWAFVGAVTGLLSVGLLILACLPLIVASAVIRNMIGRKLSRTDRPRSAPALGYATLAVLLLVAAGIFVLGKHLFS